MSATWKRSRRADVQPSAKPDLALQRSTDPLAAWDGVGTARALWRLSRPQGAFWLSWVLLIGYGFALWDWGMEPRGEAGLAVILISWWCLNAGSLWLNALLDRDEGEVLFQTSPAQVPRGTKLAAYTALGLSVLIAAASVPLAAACALGAALLAVLYSHPRTCWKGHPLGGPIVNWVGYGMLTPIAGYSQTGLPFTWRSAGTLALLSAWILGAYFAAQAFQRAEDTERGYRTLVVTHGATRVIEASRLLMAISMLGVVAGMLLGFYPRLLLLGVPMLWLTDRYIARWKHAAEAAEDAQLRPAAAHQAARAHAALASEPRVAPHSAASLPAERAEHQVQAAQLVESANPAQISLGRGGAMGLHRRMMWCGAVLFWLAYCDYRADFEAGRAAAGWATERGKPPAPQRFLEP